MPNGTEGLTPVRQWIKTKLTSLIPPATTVWSDQDEQRFKDLTGLTHDDLLKKWFEFQDGKPNYEKPGTDPTFTTCTSFLPIFASLVAQAGRMSRRLRPFLMDKETGWTPAFLGEAVPDIPTDGDFFFVREGGDPKHVGILVERNGNLWSTAAGGAGGRRSRHDGVSRSALAPRPPGIAGWLDVDAYFKGWAGPGT